MPSRSTRGRARSSPACGAEGSSSSAPRSRTRRTGDPRLDAALADHPGATLVYETLVGEGRVVVSPAAAFAMSFVPGRDGMKVTVGDRTEYLTPDDLLARQAFDQGVELPSLGFKAGLDVTLALAILADRFHMTVPDLLDRAHVRRVRVARSVPREPPPRVVTAEDMTQDDVRAGALAAAHYLARGVGREGALSVPRRRAEQPHAARLRLAAARRRDVLPRAGRGARARRGARAGRGARGVVPARSRDGRLRRQPLHRRHEDRRRRLDRARAHRVRRDRPDEARPVVREPWCPR